MNDSKLADGQTPTVARTDAERDPLVVRMPVDVRSLALTTLAVLASIALLHWASSVIIPTVLAILISYVLAPPVRWLARRGVPHVVGAFLVLASLAGVCGYGAYALADDMVEIVDSLPEAAERLRGRMSDTADRDEKGLLERVQSAATEIDKTAAEAAEPRPAPTGVTRVQIVPPPFSASEQLWASGRTGVALAAQLVMVLFLVYFLLVTDDLFKRKIVSIAGPTLSKKKISVQIMDEINVQIGNFLRVQVLTNALVAIVTGAALWAFGFENFVIWGLLAGIFNSIPYLGPAIVTGGISVVAFLQFDDVLTTAYVAGVTLAITSLEGWLLRPVLMSRAAQMNPVAIFIGLLFWSWVWGVWGTILAVPMMTTLKAICDRIEDLQPVGELLGE